MSIGICFQQQKKNDDAYRTNDLLLVRLINVRLQLIRIQIYYNRLV